MATLTVQAPKLQFDPAGPSAQLEKPVNVKLPPVTHADGQAASQDQLQKIGAFIYRKQAGAEEMWNEGEQAWQPVDAEEFKALSADEKLRRIRHSSAHVMATALRHAGGAAAAGPQARAHAAAPAGFRKGAAFCRSWTERRASPRHSRDRALLR